MERIASEDEDDATSPVPFYLYISEKAGTGKTFLMKTIIAAAKLVLMKSGDDLRKPSVLVLSPTASAARLIGGQTIESAMKVARLDDIESYQMFSNNASCAYEYH